MRKASILIAGCMVLALALNVMAYQRSHPEIMQEVGPARAALQTAIEGGNGGAAAEAAMKLQGLFQEIVPIYERMNLAPLSVEIANKAAAAAGEAAAAAKANNMEAAGAAHAAVQKTCGGCHTNFREKADDGSYSIKTGG